MASATDIITYIGIPLAVLGVLPILYTFFLSILTQRRVRHLLVTHGHKPHTSRNNGAEEGFVLRASPMTSLIEVEMPRYTIATVDRNEDKYWEITGEARGGSGSREHHRLLGHGHGEAQVVERAESTLSMVEEGRVRGFLRGGSWRTFHWRRLVVGRKLYRIQYVDELREPPAEIEFADLVNFLMDWGAELDGTGWDKLRNGGLWTPSGTVLLRLDHDEDIENDPKNGAGRGDWVLRTSMPDDSDGILTLCVRWPQGRSYGITRSSTSLPPGWGRLRLPNPSDQNTDSTSSSKQNLPATIISLIETNKRLLNVNSFRFNLESSLINKVHPEIQNHDTTAPISLSTLSHLSLGAEWFTTATSAVLTLSKTNGALWGFEPPAEITTFTRKDSVPCGVLVLLGLLPPEQAPQWHTEPDTTDDLNSATAHHRRFHARLQAEKLEATMPPEQARVHRQNREAQERKDQLDVAMQMLSNRRARDQRRLQDALVSPRVGCRGAAACCLAWLIESGDVPGESTIVDVAEAVLVLVILQAQAQNHGAADGKGDGVEVGSSDDTGEVIPVLRILEEWIAWSIAGGMKREQYDLLERRKREFCYAACLVAAVHEAAGVTTGKGKASVDMLECLRLWRKVRLG